MKSVYMTEKDYQHYLLTGLILSYDTVEELWENEGDVDYVEMPTSDLNLN